MAREAYAADGGVLDLAVIGGGVGGAYGAWRLARERPGWRMAATHPTATVPPPVRAAFVDWAEGAWHTWNAGIHSEEIMAAVVRPHSDVPVWVCSEAFSASQGWVEGALESAERVLDRLLA